MAKKAKKVKKAKKAKSAVKKTAKKRLVYYHRGLSASMGKHPGDKPPPRRK
jgi:hypothetical protein